MLLEGGVLGVCGGEPFGPVADSSSSSARADLTPCFQLLVLNTALTNGLLVLAAPWVIWRCRADTAFALSSRLLLIKVAVVLVLIGLAVADLVFSVQRVEPTVVAADTIAAASTLAAFVLALALHVITHTAVMHHGETVLLLFWLARVLVDLLYIRTGVIEVATSSTGDAQPAIGWVRFGLLCSQVILAVLMLALEAQPKLPVFASITKNRFAELSTNADDEPLLGAAVRDEKIDNELCPEDTANVFSRCTFWWLNGLVAIGHKVSAVRHDDIFPFPAALHARRCADDFDRGQRAAKSTAGQHQMLLWSIATVIGASLFATAVLKVAADLLPFLQPQLMSLLLEYLEEPSRSTDDERGYLLALALFLVAVLQSLALQQYFHACFRTGVRVRTALVTAIYSKAMRLSSAAKQQSTTGQIVNLMAVDAQRIMDFCSFAHGLWSSPITVAVALAFLYAEIGVASMVGLGCLLVLLPLDTLVSRSIKQTQKAHMTGKDHRMKLLDELVTCIKVIKLSAWEGAYQARIQSARKAELGTLTAIFYRWALQAVLWSGMPVFMTVTSLGAFVLISNEPLTPVRAFVSLALFGLLQTPLTTFPTTISSAIDAYVALGRLADYFSADEVQADAVEWLPQNPLAPLAVSVHQAEFAWSLDSGSEIAYCAHDDPVDSRHDREHQDVGITFECATGSLTAIVGPVGAGKTKLLLGLLGDIKRTAGHVIMHGRVAYVPQQAWILNASVRDNILFGLPMDESYYNAVIDACELRRDLDSLLAHDQTEVGERGITLSGGQAQRVSLARAAYAQADVYLLDDPLSAVDRQVAAHIFNHLIGRTGLLASATRLLVTHRLEGLDQCDAILTLRDGRLAEQGTYAELRARPHGAFASLMDAFATVTQTSAQATAVEEHTTGKKVPSAKGPRSMKGGDSASSRGDGKLMKQEYRVTGAVDKTVYQSYAVSVGLVRVLFLFAVMALAQAATIASALWLQAWSSAGEDGVTRVGMYLGVYAALGVAQVTLTGWQSLVASVICGLRASRGIYNRMFNQVLRARMAFFETTPLGSILNRFSKDIDAIDVNLPRAIAGYLRQLFVVLGCFVAIVYSIPVFAPFIIVIGMCYWFMQRYFMPIKRDLKRLESILRSPMIAHFAETLQGLLTIRAFHQQQRFITANRGLVDKQLRAYYYSITANRWQGIRVDMLGALVILVASVIVVARLAPDQAALGGVVLTYALQVTAALNALVRTSAETETHIVAVERVREYDSLPLEGPEIVDNARPPASWPQNGAISFRGYSTCYREGLDMALQNVDLDILPREKIGVVGRTGSGKSTMLIAIPRLLEPVAGNIIVDGIDISTIGLADLRPRIAVITQNPIMLTGTIRDNLDPLDQHSDDEIWRAVECAQLGDFLRALPNRLDHIVVQQGDNMSLGQRQLLCLARALLNRAHILLLDEATAAVDIETDQRIQRTIRTEFADCTVITIAHRLDTVMDSDRIVVLSNGRVAEVGTPAALMAHQDSLFSILLRS